MDGRGQFPVTVPATAAGAVIPLMTASCRLAGWSLIPSDASGLTGANTVVAPIAGATIAQVLAVPAGEYTCKWSAFLNGAAAAAEQDNMAIFVGATLAEVGNIPPAAGNYPQPDVTIVVPPGGATVAVKTNGAGTAGVTYGALIDLTPVAAGECVLLDGAQVVAVINMPVAASSNVHASREGIYIGNALNLKVNTGIVSGAVYVRHHSDYISE